MIRKLKIPFLINKGVKLIGAFILEDNDNKVQFLKKQINDFGIIIKKIDDQYIVFCQDKKLATLTCSPTGQKTNDQNILKIDWINLLNEGNNVCF